MEARFPKIQRPELHPSKVHPDPVPSTSWNNYVLSWNPGFVMTLIPELEWSCATEADCLNCAWTVQYRGNVLVIGIAKALSCPVTGSCIVFRIKWQQSQRDSMSWSLNNSRAWKFLHICYSQRSSVYANTTCRLQKPLLVPTLNHLPVYSADLLCQKL